MASVLNIPAPSNVPPLRAGAQCNKLTKGEVWLLLIYAKNVSDNIPAHVLREIRRLKVTKSDKELEVRDAKRDLGSELLESVRQMKADKKAQVHHIAVSDIVEARYKVGLSQDQFAVLLGVSKRTLQDWEQGRREPSGAAKSLITIAMKRPDVLLEVFGKVA